MKFWFINILILAMPAVCFAQIQTADTAYYSPKEREVLQHFNPIYGNEEESNNIISFISSNLVVELSPAQVKGIDGYVVCSFVVDTLGEMKKLKVEHSLKPWIDYAILGAMIRLPNWGRPCMRRDKKVERRFDIVFSFGSFIKPLNHMGFNGSKVSSETQAQIDEQRLAMQKELLARKNRWDGFTKENAKLEYDNQGALRKEQPVLPGSTNPINPSVPSSTTPTIKISSQKE